jgi:hypothetical protein
MTGFGSTSAPCCPPFQDRAFSPYISRQIGYLFKIKWVAGYLVNGSGIGDPAKISSKRAAFCGEHLIWCPRNPTEIDNLRAIRVQIGEQTAFNLVGRGYTFYTGKYGA